MSHNKNNLSHSGALNRVSHQPIKQDIMISPAAALNYNALRIIYPPCNGDDLFSTADPNLTTYQPIDYYGSPFSELTYDYSHLSPSSNGQSLTEEPAIFDYLSGDDSSCSPYDDHVDTPGTEECFPNIFQDIIAQDKVCVVDPSDPVTANKHVPLTFNGDPNLLIIHKEEDEAPLSPTCKLPSITEEDPDQLFDVNNDDKATSYNQEALYQLFGLGSPMSSEEDIEEEDIEEEADMAVKQEGPIEEITEQEDLEREDLEREDEELEEEEEEEEEEIKPTRSRKRKAEKLSVDTSTTTKKRKKAAAKVFRCPNCPHTSKRKYNLTTHIKTHDKNRVKEFTCSQCQKGFDRRHDRNRHLSTVHRHERAHVCNHCPAHFSRGDALNRHLIQKHGYDEGFED